MLKKMLMASLVAVMAFASTPSFAGWRNGRGGCRPCAPKCAKPVRNKVCRKVYEPQAPICKKVCKPVEYEEVCTPQPDICREICTETIETERVCKTPCKKTCPKPCAKKRCDTGRCN